MAKNEKSIRAVRRRAVVPALWLRIVHSVRHASGVARRHLTWLFAAPILAFAGVAEAQSIPADATSQEDLRQRERERLLRQQQERIPDVHLLDRPSKPSEVERGLLPEAESPCFVIERIVLAGDMAESFQWSLAAANRADDGTEDPALRRCLGSQGINRVMKRMQNAIVARGYVTTRILAAPQDLSEGTLTLTLIPGRVRDIRFAPDTDPRATRWNAVPVEPGDLLDLRDLEQGLENFKRVPTAEADIQIVPAEDVAETAAGGNSAAKPAPGESDLLIRWKQGFPFRLGVSVDDAGTQATGKYQGSVTFSYDHWLTLNDLFYVSLQQDLGGGAAGARGSRGHTAHYSVPFGYWLVGVTASQHRYHQSVAGISQTYIYSGLSRNGEIKLSRLVHRDAVRKTTLSLRGWVRSSSNYIDDTEVEVQRRRMAGWELGANHREFLGTATLDMNLAYRRGTGAMDALPAPEEAFGEGTSRPEIVTLDGQFNLPFAIGAQRLRYGLALRAQWSDTPLVPQDRFAIGGRHTVRGFDGENLLSAENGWFVRNDLGWTFAQEGGHELYLGLDHGTVGGQSSRWLVGKRLTGAVLGMRGSLKGFTYDLFAGRPIDKPDGFRTTGRVAGFNLIWSI